MSTAKETQASTAEPQPEPTIYRWNGIGQVPLANGSLFTWPVRNPVMVTADPRIQAKLADSVDDRLLVIIDPNNPELEPELMAEVQEALAHYEAGTTPLAAASIGTLGKTVAGILNSDTIRATSQRSDTAATSVTEAPKAAATAAPVNLKASLDALANAKL